MAKVRLEKPFAQNVLIRSTGCLVLFTVKDYSPQTGATNSGNGKEASEIFRDDERAGRVHDVGCTLESELQVLF